MRSMWRRLFRIDPGMLLKLSSVSLDRVRSIEQLSPNPLVYERTAFMEHIRRYDREALRALLSGPTGRGRGRLGELRGESLGVRARRGGAYLLSMEHHDSYDGGVQRDMHLLQLTSGAQSEGVRRA